MIQTFTLDDVVRYAYHEMSSTEAARFEEALVLDEELMDTFQKMDAVKKVVDTAPLLKEPSTQVVDRILDYSLKFDLTATR